jgi:hypothetical protein
VGVWPTSHSAVRRRTSRHIASQHQLSFCFSVFFYYRCMSTNRIFFCISISIYIIYRKLLYKEIKIKFGSSRHECGLPFWLARSPSRSCVLFPPPPLRPACSFQFSSLIKTSRSGGGATRTPLRTRPRNSPRGFRRRRVCVRVRVRLSTRYESTASLEQFLLSAATDSR